MTIGERIKQVRMAKGFTQKELGFKSGTSEITIRQYELGKRQPRLLQLGAIAAALDVSIDSLLDISAEDARTIHENAFYTVFSILLREMYGNIEHKDVIGQYGSRGYYLFGIGQEKFILHDDEYDLISHSIKDEIRSSIDRLKDTREEQKVIEEIKAELSSEYSRVAMNKAMEGHIDKFPESAPYFKPFPAKEKDSTEE